MPEISIADNNLSLQLLLTYEDDKEVLEQIIQFEKEFDCDERENLHQKIYRINEIKTQNCTGKFIRILGILEEVSEPFTLIIKHNNTEKRVSAIRLVITDRNNDSIACQYLVNEEFGEIVNRAKQFNSFLIFEGAVVAPAGEEYFFYLKNINTNITPLDLIQNRDYNKKEIEEKIDFYGNQPGGIRRYIKDELIDHLNIKGLDNAKELDKAIDFLILQSFSGGMGGGGIYSNKLHSLVVGMPSSGKKLLTEIAKILNPISFELSSGESKLTAAGLIGSGVASKRPAFQRMGYLPLASNGIVCIQDFHELKGKVSNLFSHLSKVMEDGKVIDSSQIKREYPAITAIHIDMNRKSQIYGKVFGEYEDLAVPSNIISRFDFIMEIPDDYQRQLDTALSMTENLAVLVSGNHLLEEPNWRRKLRLIVAYISTEYYFALISAENIKRIRHRVEEIFTHILSSDEAIKSIVAPRTINSIAKYAKAIASSKLKVEVDLEDIDEAFEYIDYKIGFLSNYKLTESEKKSAKRIRQEKILEVIGTDLRTQQEIVEDLLNQNIEAKDRTIFRDLNELQSQKLIDKKNKAYFLIKSENSVN